MGCIITHNIDRFNNTSIPAVTPLLFLEKIKSGYFDTVTEVPFLDLKAQHHQTYSEIDQRITDIISNTGFILGKHVDEFEERFAKLQEAKYCIGVSSGTDALHIALLTLGIGPKDAVIVPVNTFIATAEAVSLCGAVPVFVDCDDHFNIDVKKLREFFRQRAEGMGHGAGLRRQETEDRIQENNPTVKAIIPVHLYGQSANMDEIMALAEEYNLRVIEDCCQAHLARWKDKRVGNFGAFGAFSFYPGKNLGAYGEAGALITNDEQLFLKAGMIRQHGEIERYTHKVIGHNYRMEAIQGAVLSTKLKYLTEWTRKRKKNAQLYTEILSKVQGIQTPRELDGTDCVYHLYVIRTDDRQGLQQYLQENGIATGLHYPIPLHLQAAYKDLGYTHGDFPEAEKAAGNILSLPMYPELTQNQIRYVCEKIKEFIGKR
ncbi:MAG: DegT/DnrJ/EryC1/StrS family aminotransferase [Deltaproteobacteria bacterium]|nr:DegT/DnrJ/EryC1/StrS family aminotransferase [Deltaproteobacteria bacterium]